jgi:CRISPR-associated protein Csb2
MTIIAIRFIAGGYHATPWGHHVNEGVAEWPPSPWRLLRALISSWKRTMPAVPEERVRHLIAALSAPPSFWLPPAVLTHTRYYMPKRSPRDRTMVFDSYIALSRDERVLVIWTEDVNPDDRTLLQALLANLPYLGRSESWCEAKLVEAGEPNCFWLGSGGKPQDEYEPVRVLAPSSGATMADLMVETTDLRTRHRRIDPPGSQWLLYAVRRDSFAASLDRDSTQMVNSKPLVARYALDSVPLPPVAATIGIAELARKAVMSQYGWTHSGDESPVLAGKDKDGEPLTGNKHAYYLPTDEDEDGRLDHLTIYAPAGLDRGECEALARTEALRLRGTDVEIRLLLLGFSADLQEPSLGAFFGSSTEWCSATPFVLSRHPKLYRSGGAKLTAQGYQRDGPEDQILREWHLRCAGEPELPGIVSIDKTPALLVSGHRLSWLDFRYSRTSAAAPAPVGSAGGFSITFASQVSGPISMGYGCHYGLGLFRPMARSGKETVNDEQNGRGDLD